MPEPYFVFRDCKLMTDSDSEEFRDNLSLTGPVLGNLAPSLVEVRFFFWFFARSARRTNFFFF